MTNYTLISNKVRLQKTNRERSTKRKEKGEQASYSYFAITYLLLVVLGRVVPGFRVISSEGYVTIEVDPWMKFPSSIVTFHTQILPSSKPTFSNRMFCT